MMSHNSETHHKRNWNREVYYSQILEEASAHPEGATRGGPGRVQAGR